MITRRAALAAAAAGTAAVALPRSAHAKVADDAAVIRRALRLERLAAVTTGTGATGQVVEPELARTLIGLADHDRRHADTLAVMLEALGGGKVPAPEDLEQADALARRLGIAPLQPELDAQDAYLAYALALKEEIVAGYVEASKRLLDVRLAQTLATILASEAQHLAVLRTEGGGAAVTKPFEGASR